MSERFINLSDIILDYSKEDYSLLDFSIKIIHKVGEGT
jgi:hypothetical protein